MSMKRGVFVFVFVFALLLVSSFASAGMFDWFGKITGRATSSPVNLTITVGNTAPEVVLVTSVSALNLNEGPASTVIVVNFTVYDKDGGANINDSSGIVNLSRAGEALRQNISCVKVANYGANNRYANFTCVVTMWWFDQAGSWNISANIRDNNGASAQNSTLVTINALTGFVSSPAALTWAPIVPTDENQTSNNDELLLNNTGNQPIGSGNVQMNSTNLKGESDNSVALYAGNFTVGITTGGSPPSECGGTTMSKSVFTGVSGATLPRGNFTINDGSTGQEQLYFCLTFAGSELTSQAYSTASEGAWTVKIA